jgi:hypothetical protein
MLLGRITPDHEPERTAIVLDFWRRVAGAFRGDGKLQAFDADFTCTPYRRDTVDELVRGSAPVAEDVWSSVKKLNATLSSYMFLLYFDTRSGMVDTGPYPLDDGSVLLVRDFSKMGPSDFWWASELEVPYQNLTAAFVLRDVDVDVNDWGTSVTRPENYLDHVERFALFTTDDGALDPVPLDRVDEIRSATRVAQQKLYRDIAAMSHKERIDAGAYVYFSFLKPFADVAGAAALDWSIPRDSLDVYDTLSMFGGSAEAPAETDLPYYTPFPV